MHGSQTNISPRFNSEILLPFTKSYIEQHTQSERVLRYKETLGVVLVGAVGLP